MEIQRPSRSAHGRLAYIALAAGFIAMLSNFYYMQFLSYSVGVVRGITSIITTYNITPSNTLLTSLEGTSALAIAVHITYVMLPFTLIMFSIGAMLLITRQNLKTLSVGMLFSSLIFGMLLALMDADFYIGPIITLAPFIGVALGIYVGIKGITIASRLQEAHSLRSISIDPETPYSNMLLLSKDFFARLKGDISILDMHFDSKAMENMLALFNDSASNVKNVRILSGPERLGAHFDRGYTDFEEEMKNKLQSATISPRAAGH
ncbi:hypothetical protein Micr_00916 [Candidatus Micrarchaeum sp.]|uniref:hypothetical protein n=1 Tax=Candidatus Micrarchaeum sp. TaxID=2282148 RepID=UPI00193181E2|nr:hypothetical protein [Candidatus Micrarchaeum sp.]QRF74380.1 hypothetical protein Micr_00916 [Candidatus Micrarchaeum sp.]